MSGILPTTLEGNRGKQIAPGVWLITDPSYQPNLRKWTALGNVNGELAVIWLKAYVCLHPNQEYTFRDYRKCLDCGAFMDIYPN